MGNYLVRTLLETAQKVGLLNITVKMESGAVGFYFSWYTLSAPKVVFNGTVKIEGAFVCRVGFKFGEIEIGVGIETGGTIELKEHISDSVIYAEIILIAANRLELDFGWHLSLHDFLPSVNYLLSLSLPPINKALAKGMPMPEIPYFKLMGLDQEVEGDYISACTTLVPKF
eukprot:TRINITY_DN9353_c0_g1_i2.p1 TRINITY_DN9353_c0_g1~~TRINITY_DN9353_c0_g1_i2.p1  ORF type:complete len:171 (+),score=24.61 TRINITY_DN9353_c0_g1_i2:179-691(+)